MRLGFILTEDHAEELRRRLINLLDSKVLDSYHTSDIGHDQEGTDNRDEIINALLNLDHTPNKKFLRFIAKWFNNDELHLYDFIPADELGLVNKPNWKDEDIPKIIEMFKIFDTNKAILKNAGLNTDLNTYKLKDAIDAVHKAKTRRYATTNAKNLLGTKVIFDNGVYKIFRTTIRGLTPEEQELAIKSLEQLGIGTNWCTREAYSVGHSRASYYLKKDDIYTVFKHDVPYMQMNFVDDKQIKCLLDHEIRLDTGKCSSNEFVIDKEFYSIIINLFFKKYERLREDCEDRAEWSNVAQSNKDVIAGLLNWLIPLADNGDKQEYVYKFLNNDISLITDPIFRRLIITLTQKTITQKILGNDSLTLKDLPSFFDSIDAHAGQLIRKILTKPRFLLAYYENVSRIHDMNLILGPRLTLDLLKSSPKAMAMFILTKLESRDFSYIAERVDGKFRIFKDLLDAVRHDNLTYNKLLNAIKDLRDISHEAV
jgi:hypothetical protein